MSQPKSPARFGVIVDTEGTNRAKFRNEITVNTRRHWEAQQHGSGPYESRPLGFTLDIDLGEDASVADRRRLIEAAAKGCFIEQALKPGIVTHRLKAGGD